MTLTASQRRTLKRLTIENEPTIEGDRRFFDRFHWRSYRVRLASQAEVAMNALLDPNWLNLPEDAAAYVAVRNITSGARLRTFMWGPKGNDTDLSEADARALYERFAACPQARVIGRQMEEIVKAGGREQ